MITEQPKYNILLVDDHNLVLDGLELILGTDDSLHCVGRLNFGEHAVQFVQNNKVDIILMDINLPDINGIEVTERIVKSHPSIKVIGLSMHDEIVIVRQLIKKGAKGFLLKNSGKKEILDAIHVVINGGTYYDHVLLEKMISDDKSTSARGVIPTISRREKEILQLIIQENTTKEIAEKLFISFGTVETHRRNLINKLGVRNTAGLVRMALEYKLLD